jgi:hypothetical protein
MRSYPERDTPRDGGRSGVARAFVKNTCAFPVVAARLSGGCPFPQRTRQRGPDYGLRALPMFL